MARLIANTEVLVMCALFLFLLFAFSIRYWKPRIINSMSMIYLLAMAGCFLEIGAFWVDGHTNLIWANYLLNILYMGTILVIALCFLTYCNSMFPKPLWKTKEKQFLFYLPAIIEAAVLATTFKTGLIFRVLPDGTYIRSETFFIQFVPYVYLVLTTVMGIYWFVRAHTTQDRNNYLAIALFAIPPFVLGGFQLMVPGNVVDTLEFALSLSLVAHFAVMQNNRITRDPLTKLPNRIILDSYLQDRISEQRKDDTNKLFVMMGDMDGFKGINDTFGHVEGDRALVLVADTIYAVCKRFGALGARFGGDEFIIIVEGASELIPQAISAEIDAKLEDISKKEKYRLQMSFGYAEYKTNDMVSDMIKAADRELYRVKKERKAARA